MFDPDSRYAPLPTATHVTSDGQELVYVTRRFLPDRRDLTTLARVTTAEGDRLDLIATRVIGDPLSWWRVADANDTLHPDTLTETPGDVLAVAIETP